MQTKGVVVVADLCPDRLVRTVANIKRNIPDSTDPENGPKWDALYLRETAESGENQDDPLIAIVHPDTRQAVKLAVNRNQGVRHHLEQYAQKVLAAAFRGRAVLELSERGLHHHEWTVEQPITHRVSVAPMENQVVIYLNPIHEGGERYRFAIPRSGGVHIWWKWDTSSGVWVKLYNN